MRPPSRMLVSAVALLFASAVAAQRSSPQFSFPPPNSVASQFGADVFSANQDINLLQPSSGQSSLIQQLGSQSSPLSLTGSSQSDQPSASSSLISSSSGSQQQQQQQQQPQLVAQSANSQSAQQAQPSIQLSRPSLSLSSLSNGQSSSRSQQSSAGSSGANNANSASPQPHQSSRHHSQSASGQSSAAASHSRALATASHQSATATANANANHHNHHHHNLQTQQTSQSMNAGNNQAAIESARKAEATAASLAAASGQSYHCPDSFGFFRHHKSCDKYYACENGTAALKLCGNGLMFDDADPKRENCAYPFSVDCGADRTDLEPPISTPHCPRLYGLFADNANCRVFYSCWNGEASKYECPPGLAYDNEQRVCVWADLVERCDQSEVSDGFVCPDPTEVDQPGHYTRHAHPTDCRKFYVCIEGVARPYGCSFGTVFNVDSLQCDEPENVSGCEKYYGDMDPKLAKKLAREGTQGQPSAGANSQPSSRQTSSSSSSSSSSSNSNSG